MDAEPRQIAFWITPVAIALAVNFEARSSLWALARTSTTTSSTSSAAARGERENDQKNTPGADPGGARRLEEDPVTPESKATLRLYIQNGRTDDAVEVCVRGGTRAPRTTPIRSTSARSTRVRRRAYELRSSASPRTTSWGRLRRRRGDPGDRAAGPPRRTRGGQAYEQAASSARRSILERVPQARARGRAWTSRQDRIRDCSGRRKTGAAEGAKKK